MLRLKLNDTVMRVVAPDPQAQTEGFAQDAKVIEVTEHQCTVEWQADFLRSGTYNLKDGCSVYGREHGFIVRSPYPQPGKL